jgi:hypothetical protein
MVPIYSRSALSESTAQKGTLSSVADEDLNGIGEEA